MTGGTLRSPPPSRSSNSHTTDNVPPELPPPLPPALNGRPSFGSRTNDPEMSVIDVWRSREDEERVYRALDGIPRFDPDFVTLEDFAASIQRATQRVPPGQEERFLTELVYKLKDPIRYYVEGKGCQSVSDLLSLLRVRYSPCRGYEELRLELERISMFPRERLIDFIHRVGRLYRQVTVRARELIGENVERTIRDVERLARTSFITALPQRISTKVALSNPESLDDAFDLALHAQRREQELTGLPRDEMYGYTSGARPPSPYDPQRRWTEWRQPREEDSYHEPPSPYSAYSSLRYRDEYYREPYYRDPTPEYRPKALLTRQGEHPLDYECRLYDPGERPPRGRFWNNMQPRSRGARSYQPRESRRYQSREPGRFEPRESGGYETRRYERRETERYNPRESERYRSRESPEPRRNESQESPRTAEYESYPESRNHLNSQRARPFNRNEAGGSSSQAQRSPPPRSPRNQSQQRDSYARSPPASGSRPNNWRTVREYS